jgi:hypothetical protein
MSGGPQGDEDPFTEITRRDDIGTDLEAPARCGIDTPGYRLRLCARRKPSHPLQLQRWGRNRRSRAAEERSNDAVGRDHVSLSGQTLVRETMTGRHGEPPTPIVRVGPLSPRLVKDVERLIGLVRGPIWPLGDSK